jgi:acid phosphatase
MGGLFVACAAASAVLAAALTGCSGPGLTAAGQSAGGQSPPATSPASGPAGTGASTAGLPRPAHVVVVIEENKSYSDIIGDPSAPYINALASRGALFTSAAAVAHPSEPNYLAIFSGSTKGITDDSCPHTFAGGNLASEAIAAHLTFAGYSESMPRAGYTGCGSGEYARKHNPWSDFPNVPSGDNRTFDAFPRDYGKLPAISFVVPNLLHDMHDGTVAQGDRWLRTSLNGYAAWAVSHNSLLVLTWDEDDGSAANHIATVITGAHVRPGRYGASINHYNVLRTVEDLYGLPHVGASAAAAPLTGIF